MKKFVVGDAIKVAIKTVGGSYGTSPPLCETPSATMASPAEQGHTPTRGKNDKN